MDQSSRASMEAAHKVLATMLDEARTDYANRPNGTHEQRVRDLEYVIAKLERAMHPAKGNGEQS